MRLMHPRMLRILAALLVCLSPLALAHAQSDATLMGVDVYGTQRVTAGEISTRFGSKIHAYFQKKTSRHKGDQKAADILKQEIEQGVRAAWNPYWIRLTWMDYYSTGEHQVYITFDVVDKKDVKMRMPFNPPPRSDLSDPYGLLAAWSQYSDLGWSLVRGGDLTSDRPNCPALYCLWDSLTPELKAFETRFVQLVPKNKEALIEIIRNDKNPVHRANAVYLLGYANDGSGYVRILDIALHDPDMEVRAAALRVYSDLAIYHKEMLLPIEKIAPALDYPTVEDRNKALAVFTALVDTPDYRDYLLKRGALQMVKLLRLEQPANHDLAYAILGVLSGQKFGAQDYAAWETWIYRNQTSPLKTVK